jgi:hypothetical protein
LRLDTARYAEHSTVSNVLFAWNDSLNQRLEGVLQSVEEEIPGALHQLALDYDAAIRRLSADSVAAGEYEQRIHLFPIRLNCLRLAYITLSSYRSILLLTIWIQHQG